MKQLFTYTDLGDKRQYDAKEFIARELDPETAEKMDSFDARYDELDKKREQLEKEEKQNKTPKQRLVHYSVFAAAALFILFFVYILKKHGSLDAAVDAQPLLILVGGILSVACLVTLKLDQRLNKRNTDDPISKELDRLIEEEDATTNHAYTLLGIPSDDCELEVLTLSENDYPDLITKSETLCLTAFVEGDTLALTDYHTRYDFNIKDFRSVEKIRRELCLNDWKKYPDHNRGIYRQYKIKESDGIYTIPGYDIFTLVTDKGDFTLALPLYDGKVLADLVGLDYGEAI